MENTFSFFEVSILAPTKVRLLKRQFLVRRRRLLFAKVRQLLF
jgi:hypothetical protein